VRVCTLALLALGVGQAALADRVQPFVDYATLFSLHADEVTLDTTQSIGPVRFLDLEDGLRFACEGPEGWNCEGTDYNFELMDIGCALTSLAGMLQLAQRHEGFASDQDRVALTAMFERVVVHLSENALPPRNIEEIKADAARSAAGFATAEADAMNLGDESDVGAIILRQALKDATSAKYLAKVNERLAIKRLPVTDCGDDIGPVP
jgi:hypothetical protein